MTEQKPRKPMTKAKEHPTETMNACEYAGKIRGVVLNSNRKRPVVTQPTDAVIQITHTTICGSDLHLYHSELPGLESGDILGHEGIGYVAEVGSEVKKIKVGDRVIISPIIACGDCFYCKNNLGSLCDTTNPSKQMERQYGHRVAAMFGYSDLLGGYDGLQAEYARVPFADMNLLVAPSNISAAKLLSLSDVAVTAWHGNELGDVGHGDTVAVWGCGAVGILIQAYALYRGARLVYGIDKDPVRLDYASSICNKIAEKHDACFKTVDSSKITKVDDHILHDCPGGVDVGIEAAGFRFSSTTTESAKRMLMMQTDSSDTVNEAIRAVRKGGRIALIGDFVGTTNNFMIGALMEKGIRMQGGQLMWHKYVKHLLELVKQDKFDPSFVFTDHEPLENIENVYRAFDKHETGLKPLLFTKHSKLRPADG